MRSIPSQELSMAQANGVSKDRQRGLFKTSLCQYFVSSGKCQFGARCIYAHGADDLRVHPSNRGKVLPKKAQQQDTNLLYKTSLCRSFMSDGICLFGARCLFAHGYAELKPKPEVASVSSASGRPTSKSTGKHEKTRSKICHRIRPKHWSPSKTHESLPAVSVIPSSTNFNGALSRGSSVDSSNSNFRRDHHIEPSLQQLRISEEPFRLSEGLERKADVDPNPIMAESKSKNTRW